MTTVRQPCAALLEAYDLLLQERLVDVVRPFEPLPKGEAAGWDFVAEFRLPLPNPEKLPNPVACRVEVLDPFPFGEVSVYPLNVEVRGFPHQDAESGKLCLPAERLAPHDARRLACYAEWTEEWLRDAAAGRLLAPGDPYELPDFSRKLLKEPLPTSLPIFFEETARSFPVWESRVGETGRVELTIAEGLPALLAMCFHLPENLGIIYRAGFPDTIASPRHRVNGRWLLLREGCYWRHRPPQTYAELAEMCDRDGIAFYRVLEAAWSADNGNPLTGVVLVGFPIPEVVGNPVQEIHWQALLFPNVRADHLRARRILRGPRHRRSILNWVREQGRFAPASQLPWAATENVSRERLYARGGLDQRLRSARVVLCGCGALGAMIAESLARGGVANLTLVDPDDFKIGNQCRHPLDGSHVGRPKALALARRLQGANPLSRIVGHPTAIPSPGTGQPAEIALENADLILDCTTDDSALLWLSAFCVEKDKRFVSVFFGFHAAILTLCVSGDTVSCVEIQREVFLTVQAGQTPLAPEDYFRDPGQEEFVLDGAGCWHPTFPARQTQVALLAAAAVEALDHHFRMNGSQGIGALIIRRDCNLEPAAGNMVEVVWSKIFP